MHLNAHTIYNTIRTKYQCNTFSESLTEYLVSDFRCEKDKRINFHHFDCVHGKCENKCKIKDESDRLQFDDKLHSYYLFEKVGTTYYNRNAEEVTYYRTGRFDKKDTMQNIYQLLQEIGKTYIIHRYYVTCDRVFWSNFTTNYEGAILTLDYSENINSKPKYEAQSAHFSGRQHTLHCSVMQKNGDFNYIYHLSNDTNHDSVLTMKILEDIISNYPTLIEDGRLVLGSDNASTQYKSRFIFHKMKELAEKYEIDVIWFYGITGHGRGLVDAMSSFGCKSIPQDSITTNDE